MVWSKREDTKKKREPATVFFLFRVFKIFKKKKKSLSFSPLLSREKRKFFLKNEKKKHFSIILLLGEKERLHETLFESSLESSNQIIVFVGCVCKEERETKDDDDDDDDDSSDDDFDDRIVENTAEFFFPWEE